jgi:tetratricopeptide (TPR) repeat protein
LGEIPEIQEVAIEPVSAISPEPETPSTEELPAWLLDTEQPKDEKGLPIPSQEALEWKEEELPDWIKEITETAPPIEVPTSIEQPAPQPEPSSEWASVETPITEKGEVETIEPLPIESAWVPAAEEPIQPVTAEAAEFEEETAAALPEQPVIPYIEAPEVELSKLEDARNAINQGSPERAIEVYTSLIRQNHHLEDVIKDIQAALYNFPVDINLWMILGDAYLHTDELQEALNTYAKAEDLVR